MWKKMIIHSNVYIATNTVQSESALSAKYVYAYIEIGEDRCKVNRT